MQACTSDYSTQSQMEFVLFLSLLRVYLYAFVSVQSNDYLMVITLYNYYIIMYFFIVILLISLFI